MNNKRYIVLLSALALVISTITPVLAATQQVTTTTLPNGLKVIVYENHSTGLVAVDVWVKAGSTNETAETNGAAHFIEHLLFKSTENREPGQVDLELESLGSSAEARTSRDWAHFYTIVEKTYLGKSLEILSDVVTKPKFRQEDIDQERAIILDEITRGQSDPFHALRDALYGAAYEKHPYKFPIEGTPASIKKINKDIINDYYNRLYTPANTTVVLVGDVIPADGIAAVNKAFAGFKKKSAIPIAVPADSERTQATRQSIKRNTRLTYLGIAFPAPSIKSKPDVYAMDVLTSYLGVGYQSWLDSELKLNQRLAMDTTTDFLSQKDPGLAILMVAVEPANLQKAEDAIMEKIAALRQTPISDFDLSRAKRSLEGSYAFDVETFAGRATNLGFYDSIDSVDSSINYAANIRSVTASDVLETAKKYFDPNKAVIVVLGP